MMLQPSARDSFIRTLSQELELLEAFSRVGHLSESSLGAVMTGKLLIARDNDTQSH